MTESSPVDVFARSVLIDQIAFHDIGFEKTVELIVRWAKDGSGGVVCTPNVDYLVRARRDFTFRRALLGARLRVADGMGIVYGSRLAGHPLNGTVTGRLLPWAVASRLAGTPLRMALFGGPPGVAERAASRLAETGAEIVEAFGPAMGFRIGSAEDEAAVSRLVGSCANVVFVALGAPKQEIWMSQHRPDMPGVVLVGVGAAFDVLGGRVREAPRWMTRVGLEWAFRLAHEPRRLARRYVLDDPRFFLWMLEERLSRGRISRSA